jgi:hypothetical protein
MDTGGADVRTIILAFLGAWGLLFTITGSVWGALLFLVIVIAILADESVRAVLLRWYKWYWAKLDHVVPLSMALAIVGVIYWLTGLPLYVAIAFCVVLVILYLAAIATHVAAKLMAARSRSFPFSKLPSFFVHSCLGQTESDAVCLVMGAGGFALGLAYAAWKLWLVPGSWYWFPLNFFGGMFVGILVMYSAMKTIEAGWHLLYPVVIEEPGKPADAKLADREELKQVGLSRDL